MERTILLEDYENFQLYAKFESERKELEIQCYVVVYESSNHLTSKTFLHINEVNKFINKLSNEFGIKIESE